MADVFLSYKREDQARAARLILALQKHRLSVWWDRDLPGGEHWRRSIEAALGAARCAVVLWSHASVGPGGEFVREEATRASARQILVPVLLEKVRPPLGFGELQAIDLSRWRGSARDPFLLDLVAAIRAKLEGKPAPAPKGPMRRLVRRLTVGSVLSVAAAVAGAFATNTLDLQRRTCSAPIAQPSLSDFCGALGLGGRATRDERIAWEQRPAGSCAGLREHLRRFPDGAYRELAGALLASRRVAVERKWSAPTERTLAIHVGREAATAANEFLARQEALARGRQLAERRCRDFAAAGLHQFVEVFVQAQEWVCSRLAGGFVCGFDGSAVCSLLEASDSHQETCEAAPPGSKR
jgi:hypothetical protein